MLGLVRCDIRRHRRPQHRLRLPLPRSIRKPPDRAFLDRPFGFFAGKQQGGGLAEGGLVADDEDGGLAALAGGERPADGGEEVGGVAVGAEAFVGFVG